MCIQCRGNNLRAEDSEDVPHTAEHSNEYIGQKALYTTHLEEEEQNEI
jgi:hypothetical protein